MIAGGLTLGTIFPHLLDGGVALAQTPQSKSLIIDNLMQSSNQRSNSLANALIIPVPPPASNAQPQRGNLNRRRTLTEILVVEPAPLPNFRRWETNNRELLVNPYSYPRHNFTSPNASTSSGSYRVVVEMRNSGQESSLRQIVPGAFRTVHNGKLMMQAGIFSSRQNAEETARSLEDRGFRVIVIPM